MTDVFRGGFLRSPAGELIVENQPWTAFSALDLDETEEEVKDEPGRVGGWYIYNAAATAVFVKFYNATAASVEVGTTTSQFTVGIPAGQAANVEFARGIEFDTAITIAAVTGAADSSSFGPAANELVAVVLYD